MPNLFDISAVIKIISNKNNHPLLNAFKHHKSISVTPWSNNLAEQATQILDEETDILCLCSPKKEHIIQLCKKINTIEPTQLIIYVISPIFDKGFINHLFLLGVKAIFRPFQTVPHLRQQIQQEILAINEKKQINLNCQQHKRTQQLAKLGNFTWFIEKYLFYFPEITKAILGLDMDGHYITQNDFIKLIDEVNQPHLSFLLNNVIHNQLSIKTNIKLRQINGYFREFIFIAEQIKLSDNDKIYEGFIQDTSSLYSRSMHSLAYTDTLTGLANRNCLIDYMHNMCIQSKLQSTFFSILFLDLDGFKQVND